MRVACVYLPAFPLQVRVRDAPHLAGRPVVVTNDAPRPRVIAVSRAAWEVGARCDMSPAHARALHAGMIVQVSPTSACHDTVGAVAESLLALSPVVDVGAPSVRAHKALFVQVPHAARGATFGERLLAATGRQGLRARVGIADDRFTAWAAAAVTHRTGDPAQADLDGQPPLFVQSCTTVPRGGSAAFLAPLPMALLPMDDELRRMLVSLHVRTLGDFAALPPPSTGHRWPRASGDLHALARGDGPADLAPYVPRDLLTERVELEDPATDVAPIAFLLHPVIDRVCERLRGRGRAATGIRIRLDRPTSGEPACVHVAMPAPTVSSRAIVDAVRAKLIACTIDHPVCAASVSVIADTEPNVDDLDLFAPRPHRRTRRGKRHRRRHTQRSLPFPSCS